MACTAELRHRMLLFLLVFTAILGQVVGAPEQNTRICNSCSSNEDRKRPVCGSDNLTYQNRCQLLLAKCQGVAVTMQHRGRCKGKMKNVRRSLVRGRKQKKGCAREDRLKFNTRLLKKFRREYQDAADAYAVTVLSQEDMTDKFILDWKFFSLDKDRDDFLAKTEYRDLRRWMKVYGKPKRCAKTFTKLCDPDEDEKISKEEWMSCLGLDFNLMQMTATTPLLPQDDDSSLETGEEAEANNCYDDRKAVLEEQLTTNSDHYVPECTPDGRYQKIQCYKSTGYCWCVHEENGKPIPGTSVKNQIPKCSSLPPPSRTMSGCPEPNKQNFMRELMNVMRKNMAAANTTDIGSTSVPLKDSRPSSPEVQIATWNFLMLDKNKNKVLEKKEWKNFRSLVSSKPQLRRCGKRLPRYCDVNQDRKITLTEWLNCLNTQTDNTLAASPTSASRRRGENPLQIYLRAED